MECWQNRRLPSLQSSSTPTLRSFFSPRHGLNQFIWQYRRSLPAATGKKTLMFNALLPHFIFIAILLLVLAIFTIGKFRYMHIVSEGYVGWLCHKGKFVRVLAPDPHVHWGRHFTIRRVDVRRASILLPDQDGKTGSADRKPEDGAS